MSSQDRTPPTPGNATAQTQGQAQGDAGAPGNDARLDQTLREIGDAGLAPPPLSSELESEMAELKPVRLHSRRHRFLMLGMISLVYGAGLLWFMKLRPDLGDLPWAWTALYGIAWLTGFMAIAWFALVPGPGKIMPSWRYAGIGAVVASIGFVLAGLVFDHEVPGRSVMHDSPWDALTGSGTSCLFMGIATALVPVAVGALLLRGRVPVGSHWAGAGLGAAGGSLGGLLLHLHCPLPGAVHLGIIHGGVVCISAILGALFIPRAANA